MKTLKHFLSNSHWAAIRGASMAAVVRRSHWAVLLYLIIYMGGVSSCVHEFPEDYDPNTQEVEVNVKLSITDEDLENNIYQTIIVTRSNNAVDYSRRYILEVYKQSSSGTYSTKSVYRGSYVYDDLEQLTHNVSLTLDEGTYRFIVWSDYVDKGTDVDKYYNSDSFSDVSLLNPYEGATDFRDCFLGVEYAELDYSKYRNGDTLSVEVPMERPVAKFSFLATDLSDFIDNVISIKQQNGEISAAEAEARAIDLAEYNVVATYSGFVPSAYSLFSNKPVDSTSGLKFGCTPEVWSEDESMARLAFDYVFVGDSETTVAVSLTIYDNDGNTMGSTSTISVPLYKGMHTLVMGKFLTTESDGGVGINPDFDGEYNIQVE